MFEVSASGGENVLYNFCSLPDCDDGYRPRAGLIRDAEGDLYGTTYDGGPHDGGTVFELSPGGVETILYSFCYQKGCRDGYYPHAPVIMDANGDLYGTTQYRGAYGGGIVFEVSANGAESVVYNFCEQANCADGSRPRAGLALDAKGNLYGTTYYGGANGQGVIFKLTPGGTETVLYSFCAQAGCADGSNPQAGVVVDANGNVYGTTVNGGANGKGTVFEVSAGGIQIVLYNFCAMKGCMDGSSPQAGLIMDAMGNLYGTTYSGGSKRRGTVFEIGPGGGEIVLHNFSAKGTDGYNPVAGLAMDTSGNLFGTTLAGGVNKGGTVFRLVP